MRPKRKLLLLASEELELSRWRFLLGVHRYQVIAACSVSEALRELEYESDCYLALVIGCGDTAGVDASVCALSEVVSAHEPVRVLLADVPAAQAFGSHMAAAVLPRQPGMQGQVLDRLKVLGALKRGPRACPAEPVRPCAVGSVAALAEFAEFAEAAA